MTGTETGGSATPTPGDENNGMDDDSQPSSSTARPLWTLEDIQPESARFGDVYGLEHFEGEVLVAVLVQGF